MRWRAVIADLVWLVHAGVTTFFVVAWALPWDWALWTAFCGAFAMQLQWWLNDDVCVLTKLERNLRGHAAVPAATEGNFISGFLSTLLGRPLPVSCTDRIAYVMLWGGAGIAGARLALR